MQKKRSISTSNVRVSLPSLKPYQIIKERNSDRLLDRLHKLSQELDQSNQQLANSLNDLQCEAKGDTCLKKAQIFSLGKMIYLCPNCLRKGRKENSSIYLHQITSINFSPFQNTVAQHVSAVTAKLPIILKKLDGIDKFVHNLIPSIAAPQLQWRSQVLERSLFLRRRGLEQKGPLLKKTLIHLRQLDNIQSKFDWIGLRTEQAMMLNRIVNSFDKLVIDFHERLKKEFKEIEDNWYKFMNERKKSLSLHSIMSEQQKQHSQELQKSIDFLTEDHILNYNNKALDQSQLLQVIRTNQAIPNIVTIDFGLNKLSWRVAKQISLGKFDKLKQLNLTAWSKDRSIGPKGAQFLSKADWPNLKKLWLIGNKIGDKGATAISKAKWPKLKLIDLSFNKISDEAMQDIFRGDWPELNQLTLNDNLLTEKGLEQANINNWLSLQSLSLQSNRISPVQTLCKCNWPKLRKLNLNICLLKDGDIEWLVKASWPQLQELQLQSNKITDESLEHLMQSHWEKLRRLSLYNNLLTQQGIKDLSRCGWNRLIQLRIGRNKIHAEDQLQGLFKKGTKIII